MLLLGVVLIVCCVACDCKVYMCVVVLSVLVFQSVACFLCSFELVVCACSSVASFFL